MIIMSQAVGWANIMNMAVNSKGPSLAPGFKETPYISLFFLIFMIFGAFFIVNLFVGVIISAYNREIDKNSTFLVTTTQSL